MRDTLSTHAFCVLGSEALVHAAAVLSLEQLEQPIADDLGVTLGRLGDRNAITPERAVRLSERAIARFLACPMSGKQRFELALNLVLELCAPKFARGDL